MSAQPGPVYQRAIDLLRDGEWHDYQEVLRKIAIVVPPGQAVRQAERQRAWIAQKHNYLRQERKVHRTAEELIRIGAATIARRTLANSRRFEMQPPVGTRRTADRRIRLKP